MNIPLLLCNDITFNNICDKQKMCISLSVVDPLLSPKTTYIVEINYVCADFIGNSITKITSNKGRGPKARVLYLEGIFVI